MPRTKMLMILALTAMLVVGTTVPAASVGGAVTNGGHESATVGLAAANETNNSSVDVTVGQQLSTVVAATSDDVQTDFENTAFEVTYESANETERVEAIAERAESLHDRVEEIREEYRDATAAYRAGELNRSEYGQRIAVLNARAQNLLRGYDRLQDRVENTSAFDLRAAGVNRSALNRSVTNLDAVTGTGPAALLDRYTGQTEGELEIEADRGLKVEIENEEGERSLELDRPRDGDYSITVDQSAALETARTALGSAPDNSSWALTDSSIHPDSGYYRFRFDAMSANASGEAEVRVDGSSGEIFRLEQEVESDDETEREDRGDDEREDGDDRELALLVAGGTPAPNETITVKALSAGEPVADATVYVDGRAVGSTDDSGTVTLTLPAEGATVEAVRGDREGELEFEFEDDENENEALRDLSVSGSMDDGTVTVSVSYSESPVSDATVYADGDRVGVTDADGTVTFTSDAREDLEVKLEKGEFEVEVTFVVSGDTLTRTETEYDGASDEDERDDDDDHRETETEDEQETEDGDDDDDDDDDDDHYDDDDEEDDDDTTTET